MKDWRVGEGGREGERKDLELLAVLLVDAASDGASGVSEEAGDAGLGDDAGALGALLADLLELLHEGVGDGHAGETLLAAVGAGLGVATEAGEEGEIEVEAVLEPVD